MAVRANTKKRSGGKKRSVKKVNGVWLLVMVLFIGELLFYAWCRVQCVQLGVLINTEQDRAIELRTMQDNLRIELARLKAPERISYIARRKLGLDMPEPSKTIMVP